MSEVIVIYDGLCQLCKNSVNWVGKKLEITAIAYQECDLSKYDLTLTECEKSVQVIYDKNRYQAAKAVSILLKLRGNLALAAVIALSGGVGNHFYYWIARNRSSLIVKLIGKFIK